MEEAGFKIYTAAGHQGAIKVDKQTKWIVLCLSFFQGLIKKLNSASGKRTSFWQSRSFKKLLVLIISFRSGWQTEAALGDILLQWLNKAKKRSQMNSSLLIFHCHNLLNIPGHRLEVFPFTITSIWQGKWKPARLRNGVFSKASISHEKAAKFCSSCWAS